MNYMKQVAEMLGVEFEERFILENMVREEMRGVNHAN